MPDSKITGLTAYTPPLASDAFVIVDVANGITKKIILSSFAAVQATQETGTSNILFVTPGVQQYHQSAAKAFVFSTGATWAIQRSYNISSVTDVGTGTFTVNFTTAFSDANYCWGGGCRPTAGGDPHYVILIENKDNVTRSTTALEMYTLNAISKAAVDMDNIGMVFFGDQ